MDTFAVMYRYAPISMTIIAIIITDEDKSGDMLNMVAAAIAIPINMKDIIVPPTAVIVPQMAILSLLKHSVI